MQKDRLKAPAAVLALTFQIIPHASLASQLQNATVRTVQTGQTPDYSKEGSVILSLQTVVSFQADGSETRQDVARIRLQSEAGIEQWGLLSFSFNSSNQVVEIGYVRVVKPDGTVVATAPSDVQDVTAEVSLDAPMYSDYREKHVPVKGLGAGDVLEYKVTTRDLTPLVPNEFWFDFDFEKARVALDQELQVRVPKDRELNVKSPAFKSEITEEGNERVYAWKAANLKQDDWQFSPNAPPPDVQISTFKTWEEVGRW